MTMEIATSTKQTTATAHVAVDSSDFSLGGGGSGDAIFLGYEERL